MSTSPVTGTSAPLPAQPAVPQGSRQQAPVPASQANPTAYVNNGTAAGGGVVDSFTSAVVGLMSFASRGINQVQTELGGLLGSGGEVDQARVAYLNQKHSQFVFLMEQVAKMEEENDRARRAALGR